MVLLSQHWSLYSFGGTLERGIMLMWPRTRMRKASVLQIIKLDLFRLRLVQKVCRFIHTVPYTMSQPRIINHITTTRPSAQSQSAIGNRAFAYCQSN